MDARASLRMSLGYDSPATKPMGLLGVRTCDRVDQNPEDTATVRAARSKAQGLWAEARLRGWQEIRPVVHVQLYPWVPQVDLAHRGGQQPPSG